MIEQEYIITAIEDFGTPLAASVSGRHSLFPLTLVILTAFIFLVGALIYYVECCKYRERYYILCSSMGAPEQAGWNLWKLREEVMEMENERVSLILSESW